MIHVDRDNDFPDVGNGEVPCCMGSAVYGPGRCTCWVPVYDLPQAPECAGPMRVRDRMCADCAFRPNSPERSGDDRYAHADEDGLEDVLREGFVCHQGMRRVLRYEHPSGATHAIAIDAYSPPSRSAPTRADGTPAEMCAGWWAEKQRRAAGGAL